MRTDLPTGTVTFLFTDIEGSTKLLTELGDGYAHVLSEHHRLLRSVWDKHGGVEVDTAGDAFFVAFARPSDAVRAAGEAQRALAALPVRVRMGIHTGEPKIAATGYIGPDVHRAARIAAAAHGGQALLTESTKQLVDTPLRDLGLHRLKDFAEPQRLFQLGDAEFPPPQSLFYADLPEEPTGVIGRHREIGELAAAVSSGARLVTLTGPGGIGKTRLALATAAELSGRFRDGTCFVGLSTLSDPALVESQIGQAVGARGAVAEHMRHREMLLVLDNFEHLLPGAAIVGTILRETRAVQVIATSRERLGLSFEHEYVVPTLAYDDAEALFTARARQAKHDFEPDGHLAAIIESVDRLPLALELAAARVKLLPTREIAARLQSNIDLLASRHRDLPERQRTLRGAIEWSHDLLAAAEQDAFALLAVFAGGFAVEAAESVVGVDLEIVASLLDKSLLRSEGDGRISMLRTVRARALELLEERADARDVHERHAVWVEELVGDGRTAFEPIPSGATWFDLLDAEQSNLRAALDWLAGTSPHRFAKLAARAFGYWYVRGLRAEGLRWVERALEVGGERTDLLSAASNFAVRLGSTEQARRYAERQLALAERDGDPRAQANALRNIGITWMQSGQFGEAERCYERGLDVARAASVEYEKLLCACNLGDVALHREDWSRVVALLVPLEEALSRASAETALTTAFNLALAQLRLGDLEAAAERVDAALVGAEAVFFQELLGAALFVGGAILAERGDVRAAIRVVGAGAAVLDEIGAWVGPLEEGLRDAVRLRAAAQLGAEAATLEEAGRHVPAGAAVAEARAALAGRA